jgi:hypothetical protein
MNFNAMERKQKNSLVHKLMFAAGVRDHKEALLEPYGVDGVSDLSDTQIDELIERLQRLPQLKSKKTDTPKEIRNLRAVIIISAEQYMGIKISDPDSWDRFNKLMLNSRICGKFLWELNEDELKALNKKFRVMNSNKTEQRHKENFMAMQN